MGSLGFTELIVIFLILVVLFGARKIPDLMRGLGIGIREFKKAAQLEDDNSTASNPPASVHSEVKPSSLPASEQKQQSEQVHQSQSNV